MAIQDFLGKGIALPFATDAATGDVSGVSQDANVAASVRMFLSTIRGERVFFESYGVPLLLFENLDAGLLDQYRASVEQGLATYEPRIKLLSVQAQQVKVNNLLGVRTNIRYLVRATNTEANLVYERVRSEDIRG